MITRPETAADVAAIREVNLQAFGREYEPDVVERLRAEPSAWLPELSIVATADGGEVVGHVLLTRCHVDETPALMLGPVAVLPAHQGQGVGGTLVRAGLDAARADGHQVVVLLGHPTYYPRFGFKQAADFGITTASGDTGPHLMVFPLGAEPIPAGTIRSPSAWDA